MADTETPVTCDVCGREFKTTAGRNQHKTLAHTKKRRTPRKAAPKPLDRVSFRGPEGIVELDPKVSVATEILFPDGVPVARIREVAAWQDQTSKLIG